MANFFKRTLQLIMSLASVHALSAENFYPVDAYVDAVLKASASLEGSADLVKASQLDRSQGDLATSPQLSSSLTILRDRQPSQTFSPSYSGTKSQTFDVGVSQQFASGTSASLSFEVAAVKLSDFRAALQAPAQELSFGTFTPTLELSQALWQNWGGQLLSLQKQVLAQQENLQTQQFALKKQNLSINAKAAYYRLAFARDRVSAAKKTLDTAEKIERFVQDMHKKNLFEKSDLLQAKALVESRRVDFQSALSEERSASFAFNAGRGSMIEQVPEKLVSFRLLENLPTEPPTTIEVRPELAVIREQVSLAASSVSLQEEKIKPTFDAFASYALPSREDTEVDAMAKVLKPFQPTLVLGLRLQMTLDRDLVHKQVAAERFRLGAAQKQHDDTKQALTQALGDLKLRREDAVKTLKFAKSLESVQRERLENEEKLLHNGRSSTYQVLLAVQDLAQAELNRIKAVYDVMMLDTQLSFFRDI